MTAGLSGSVSNGATSYEELRGEIARQHRSLPDRLQQIAEFALEHPTEMALGTVAEVAQRAGVQPSAIVRFARALGYGGFTEMQQIFRSRLVAGLPASYKERIGRMKREGEWRDSNDPNAVLSRFISEGIVSLEHLSAWAHDRDLKRAIAVLSAAETIYLLGLGGSFPVAAHLAYVLRKLGRRIVLLDGLGSALSEQAALAARTDALMAISFRNYNSDTVRTFADLAARGVPAVSITDSLLSPIAQGANVVFEIQDMQEAALRTLVAPMCLAQSLAVGLGLVGE